MSFVAAFLPGTIMIMNGAQKGVSGFSLASDPDFFALLYDLTQPASARISILNTTSSNTFFFRAIRHRSGVPLRGDAPLLAACLFQAQTRILLGAPKNSVEVYILPHLNGGLTQPNEREGVAAMTPTIHSRWFSPFARTACSFRVDLGLVDSWRDQTGFNSPGV
ncbi:hypothetical protein EDB85DRAFT_2296321 [Lactarius pseudohatsudake]|nr:hypothetical protein EDB85DRAFT_2296321 [Lactarius pseudohatsudake]